MDNKVSKIKDYAVSQFTRDGDKMGYAFRNERYRYVIWMKDNFTSERAFEDALIADEELYDYVKDAEERKNLAFELDYVAIKAQLKNQAIAFFKEHELKH